MTEGNDTPYASKWLMSYSVQDVQDVFLVASSSSPTSSTSYRTDWDSETAVSTLTHTIACRFIVHAQLNAKLRRKLDAFYYDSVDVIKVNNHLLRFTCKYDIESHMDHKGTGMVFDGCRKSFDEPRLEETSPQIDYSQFGASIPSATWYAKQKPPPYRRTCFEAPNTDKCCNKKYSIQTMKMFFKTGWPPEGKDPRLRDGSRPPIPVQSWAISCGRQKLKGSWAGYSPFETCYFECHDTRGR
ncbi:hypothetical protein MRB53_042325 [Persea americana]|nr:hypothetical protein MRB53_042325 [Persea americana]